MDKQKCGRCSCLGTMFTRTGWKDCCKWFHEPQLLENVICDREQHGYGELLLPRIKGYNFDPNL